MRIVRHIPNAITCLNLISGCIASVAAVCDDLWLARIWILAAAVFDFFDGFAARLLHAPSPIGKELDSLADVVSFGVAPGMIVYSLLAYLSGGLPFGVLNDYLPYGAFVIPAFSALRLAKFNLDPRQATSFIGLPVPAHALFWASLGYSVGPMLLGYGTLAALLLLALALGTSIFLISEIPMFSLKVKSLAFRGNELRYVLVAGGIVFIALWRLDGILPTAALYLILALVSGLCTRPSGSEGKLPKQ